MNRMLLSLVAVAFLASTHPHAAAAAQRTASPRAGAKAPLVNVAGVAAVINLNTASVTDLESLPGIGAKTAARIVEYRQKNGPFKKVEELMNIRGVGEKNFLKLKAQITVAATKAARTPQEQ
jgi:competence protein ComEA